jgi:hypothetical protein
MADPHGYQGRDGKWYWRRLSQDGSILETGHQGWETREQLIAGFLEANPGETLLFEEDEPPPPPEPESRGLWAAHINKNVEGGDFLAMEAKIGRQYGGIRVYGGLADDPATVIPANLGDRRLLLSIKCYAPGGAIYRYNDIIAGVYEPWVARWHKTLTALGKPFSFAPHHEPDHLPGQFRDYPGTPAEFVKCSEYLFDRFSDLEVTPTLCLMGRTIREGKADQYLSPAFDQLAVDEYTGDPARDFSVVFSDDFGFCRQRELDLSVWEFNTSSKLSDSQAAVLWEKLPAQAEALGVKEFAAFTGASDELGKPWQLSSGPLKLAAYAAAGQHAYFWG